MLASHYVRAMVVALVLGALALPGAALARTVPSGHHVKVEAGGAAKKSHAGRHHHHKHKHDAAKNHK